MGPASQWIEQDNSTLTFRLEGFTVSPKNQKELWPLSVLTFSDCSSGFIEAGSSELFSLPMSMSVLHNIKLFCMDCINFCEIALPKQRKETFPGVPVSSLFMLSLYNGKKQTEKY